MVKNYSHEELCDMWAMLKPKRITAQIYPRHYVMTYHCEDRDRTFVVGRNEFDEVRAWEDEMDRLYGEEP